MHILMFGWEFPPWMSGGLGTACLGITRALTGRGHRITFVLPRIGDGEPPPFLRLLSAADLLSPDEGPTVPPGVTLRPVRAALSPYLTQAGYHRLPETASAPGTPYGPDLLAEVARYGRAAGAIARNEPFDVIHAHDWLAVPAALEARRLSGRPLVLHVHSLEYDRSGGKGHEAILAIEREGLAGADRVIAVSHRTRRMIVERFGVPAEKVAVVHNAVSQSEAANLYRSERRHHPRGQQIVLFLGRITFQKGPEYFVEAAAKVLEVLPETRFIMAGDGDLVPRMVERVAALGIGDRFLFAGFLQGEEVERIFSLSHLYVMPSVSEPFGIAPLEAMLHDVPVIVSRQSGVAELVQHALKVDFWNVEEIAAKIIALLTHPVLADEMTRRAREALRTMRWEEAARRIEAVYDEITAPAAEAG